MTRFKLLAGAALLSALLACGWGWHATYQNLQAVNKDLELAEAREDRLAAVLEQERQQRAELEAARSRYLDELQVKTDEISALRRDLDSSARRLHIRATCPAVSRTGADAGGAEEGAAELDAAAEQAYLDLRAGIGKVESLLSLCRSELRARSAP